jgi:hypothetical protein
LIGEDFFVSVEEVSLREVNWEVKADQAAGVTGRKSTVENLRSLPRLRRLFVNTRQLTDADLKTIGTLSQLERLSISSAQVTDAGTAHLAQLSRLKGLDLMGEQLSDASIVSLSPLTRLESLQLRGGQMTNEGLAALRRLPNLRGLTIYGNAWSLFAGTKMTGRALVQISELAQLENLSVQCIDATDTDLECLQRLKTLKSASFDMTQVTKTGMARLQEVLPSAQLMASTGAGSVYVSPVPQQPSATGAFTFGPLFRVPSARGY